MKALLTFIVFLFVINSNAQKTEKRAKAPNNYFELKKAFEEGIEQGKYSEKEQKYFARYQWFCESRIDSNGTLNTANQELVNYLKKLADNPQLKSTGEDIWEPIGPFNPLTGYSSAKGIGRVESVWVDPNNHDIIYAGADAGGLWRTTDGGTNWECLTNYISGVGVYDILVFRGETVESDIIYIATGIWGNGTMHGGYSVGILKSIDGGHTWAPSLDLNPGDKQMMRKIISYPSNDEILFAISYSTVYRSYDAGNSWEAISDTSDFNSRITDIVFHPTETQMLYVSGFGIMSRADNIFDPENVVWNNLLDAEDFGSPIGEETIISIQTNPIEPDYLFALMNDTDIDYHIYLRSTNKGNSLTWSIIHYEIRSDISGALGLECSPTNINHLFSRNLNIYFLDKDNNTETQLTYSSKIHADVRDLQIFEDPGNPDDYKIFAATDGGLFVTTDLGSNWTDLSGNMQLNQFYGFDVSQTDPVRIIGGTHDCGTMLYENGIWETVYGCDGGYSLLTSNTNLFYFDCNGTLKRTTNRFKSGSNSSLLTEKMGGYGTPYITNPLNENVIFASSYVKDIGYRVFRIVNGVADYINPFNPGIWASPHAMAMSEVDTNYFYLSAYTVWPGGIVNKFRITKDCGATWTDKTDKVEAYGLLPPGPGSIKTNPLEKGAKITDILIDPSDPETIWVTFDHFVKGHKVYKSTDAGETWGNLSWGLENFPVHAIALDPLEGYLYLGTDIGVYYKRVGGVSWTRYGSNMPHAIVSDIECNKETKELYVATYGRGIWKAPLKCDPDPAVTYGTNVTQSHFSKFAESITSSATITNNVTYVGTDFVKLESGFKGYNNFKAYVEPCMAPTMLKSLIGGYLIFNDGETNEVEKQIQTEGEDISLISPEDADINIYPNPTFEKLSIVTENKHIISIELISITGTEVYSIDNPGNSHEITMLPYQKGMYLVRVNTVDDFYIKTIVYK